jgi:hypothetical protein
MSNIIIIGDSFCANKNLWPKIVADNLNLNLIHFGKGGCHWWSYKKFLDNLNDDEIKNTQIIICCHTWTGRIPEKNNKLNLIDHANLNTKNEIDLAIDLYFKQIYNDEYAAWAEIKWFEEFSKKFSHAKIINLHCFPWSINHKSYLKGMNVLPSLASISLNDKGAENFELFQDNRPNHLSIENNKILGEEIINLISNYEEKDVILDTSKFNLLMTKWFEWN